MVCHVYSVSSQGKDLRLKITPLRDLLLQITKYEITDAHNICQSKNKLGTRCILT